jgi:hypothetical protein
MDFQDYDVAQMTILAMLHSIFYFFVGVLLLNFPIALFSKTVAVVTVDKDVYVILEKIAITSTIQYRIVRAFPCVRMLLKSVEHNLVEYNGKVGLLCVSPVKRQKSCRRNNNS